MIFLYCLGIKLIIVNIYINNLYFLYFFLMIKKDDLEKLANYDFDNYENENIVNDDKTKNEDDDDEDNKYDQLGDEYLIDDDEEKAIEGENMEDYNERIRRSGVIYLSYIPQGLNSQLIREKFETYGVNRIFLVPGK